MGDCGAAKGRWLAVLRGVWPGLKHWPGVARQGSSSSKKKVEGADAGGPRGGGLVELRLHGQARGGKLLGRREEEEMGDHELGYC